MYFSIGEKLEAGPSMGVVRTAVNLQAEGDSSGSFMPTFGAPKRRCFGETLLPVTVRPVW